MEGYLDLSVKKIGILDDEAKKKPFEFERLFKLHYFILNAFSWG